jgi:hypothetical protein
MKYLSFLFVFLLVFACTPGKPYGVMSEGDMEDVLFDYHLALAMAEQQTGDLAENRYILVQAALKKHGITEAELDTSLLYWCKNSEKFVKICNRVSERLSFMAESQGVERQEKNPYSYLTTEGDTANVWNLRKNVVLIPNMVDNIYSFSIEADTTYHAGDYFLWAFKTQFLSSDHYNEAYALLSIQYENDSVVGTSQRLSSSRQIEIRMKCATKYRDVRIRSINGTIYMPLRNNGFGILALNNFVLVRYHDLTISKNDANMLNVAPGDSIASIQIQDSARTRRNPYDIRNEQNDERTINIVRDKPLRINRRRR